jgi:hypothetical protein
MLIVVIPRRWSANRYDIYRESGELEDAKPKRVLMYANAPCDSTASARRGTNVE